jgi:isoamylase
MYRSRDATARVTARSGGVPDVVRQTAQVSGNHSRPFPLGVHPRDGGVAVAVRAAHADRVQLCLLDPAPGGGWTERRVDLPERTHGVWHGFVPDVPVGQRYGLRVHGPWDPRRGHRHNPAKLLLDPYARAVVLPRQIRPELFGHHVGPDLSGDTWMPDFRDSAPHAAHGVVIAPADGPRTGAAGSRVPWAETVVYELHVRGFTRTLPGIPEPLRGTYAGLAHPAAVEHLVRLGVTTIELLPAHAFLSEPALMRRGLQNYWGYNSLAFFAPHPAYAAATASGSADGPAAAVAEFRSMVDALHEAGLEVLLDVVYNHTCEGGVDGPTLSLRGIDAATYYRLDEDGHDVDTTGCGNSLDARNVAVVQLVLDSLRYWVEEMHVDGFRFDLAPTLARGQQGFTPDHPLLVAIRTDPTLTRAKLIAEPWDVGPFGWRTGQFPAPFAEWNDRYRDGARDFWLRDVGRVSRGEPSGGVRDMATRLAGSADTFPDDRGPLASVNFVTAHDGFTLADAASYDHKHNLANGEGNRDGSNDNRSWNHGAEGVTEDEAVLAARRRSIRNLLGTLLLSAGVPMIVAGDEFGRTQHGNNNAYCQDNAVSWLDWQLEPWQVDLLETTGYLLRLRREHPVLRRRSFYNGRPLTDGTKDIGWFTPAGTEMDHQRWQDSSQRTLQVFIRGEGRGDGSLLIMIQGRPGPLAVTLPRPPWATAYSLLWDSADETPPKAEDGDAEPVPAGTELGVDGPSLRVYRAHR